MAQSKGVYPAPIYVAEFAGGEKIRVSYFSPKGKPLTTRLDAVRPWVAGIIGRERANSAAGAPYEFANPARTRWRDLPVAEDMIGGHIEHLGERVDDPLFSANGNVTGIKRRAKRSAGPELDRALAALRGLLATFGDAFPEECAAAAAALNVAAPALAA